MRRSTLSAPNAILCILHDLDSYSAFSTKVNRPEPYLGYSRIMYAYSTYILPRQIKHLVFLLLLILQKINNFDYLSS